MVYTIGTLKKTNRNLEAVCDNIDYIQSCSIYSGPVRALHGLQVHLTDTEANIFVWSQLEIQLSLHLTTYNVDEINLTLHKVQLSVAGAFSIAPSISSVPLVTVLCSHKFVQIVL